MKKLLILLLFPLAAFGQNLELPYSVKVVNPYPTDAYYYNLDRDPYVNTAEVLSEVPAGVRYQGQTFNVSGVEYWFKDGILNADLEEKYPPGPGTPGTVTSVSVVTANGVSGSVATATTTPAITLTLGAITPTSVNSVVVSGASTPTLAVTGTTTVSGTNTGDQTLNSLLPSQTGNNLKFLQTNGTNASWEEIKAKQKTVTTTTYTISNDDNGYTIYFTNVAGCTVTLDDAVSTDIYFNGVRADGAGQIDFTDDGTSVLFTIGNEYSLESEKGEATWTKRNATDFYGIGTLGPAAGGGSGTVTSIATTSPITGGTITTTGTIGIADAAADATTKGAATFNASDFNSSAGLISSDYTNGQSATSSTKGYLIAADWTTFNSKQAGDADLTTIAGLTPTNGDFIQYTTGAWANRTATQATATLDAFTSGLKGLAPASGGGTTNFLRADGTWAAPPGGGGGITNGAANNELMKSDGTNAVASGVFSTSSGVITTGTWNGTDIAYGFLTQGSALSVLGVTGNATADNASIAAGADFNILRRSGTSVAFGSIDLSQSGAVGSSILPAANGGTGLSALGTGVATWLGTPSYTNFLATITGTSPYYLLASGGTLTGANTITSNARNQMLHTGTWTSTTNADYHLQISPTITADANSRTIHAFSVRPTMATGGFSNTVLNAAYIQGRTVIQGLTTSNTAGTFQVMDSGGNLLIDVSDDGNLRWFNAGSRPQVSATSDGTSLNKNGNGLLWSAGAQGHNFSVTSSGAGVANGRALRIGGTHVTTSGTTTLTGLLIDYTVNQSGGTGDSYGIRFNPTYTAVGGISYFIVDNSTSNSGFGTNTPLSKLESARSFGVNITATATDITLDGSHHTVVVDASGAARTITLPTATSSTRRIYVVLNDTGTNTVTVDGAGSENIGSPGATTYVIPAVAGSGVTIQSNGTKWLILSLM